jgi:hypothetical protein
MIVPLLTGANADANQCNTNANQCNADAEPWESMQTNTHQREQIQTATKQSESTTTNLKPTPNKCRKSPCVLVFSILLLFRVRDPTGPDHKMHQDLQNIPYTITPHKKVWHDSIPPHAWTLNRKSGNQDTQAHPGQRILPIRTPVRDMPRAPVMSSPDHFRCSMYLFISLVIPTASGYWP